MYHIDNLAKITNSWNQQPLWNHFNNRLYWVDKHSQHLFSLDIDKKDVEQIKLPEPIVSLSLYKPNSSKLLVCLNNGIGTFDLTDNSIEHLFKPEPLLTNNHFCGGTVGPNNEYWTQSTNLDAMKSSGFTYRLNNKKHLQRFKGAALFNSSCPAISKDNKMLYQVSHHDRYIYKSNIDEIDTDKKETFCRISKTEGKPYGICLDREDHLWVCHLGGGLVSRFNPEGQRVEKIKIHANSVTHCTFGGKNLDMLFITTASLGLTTQGQKKQSMAGSILRIHLDEIRGLKQSTLLP